MDYNLLKEHAEVLVEGASDTVIEQFEKTSGITFPEDYKALLRFSDGCMVRKPVFVIFFSCGAGFHEKETLTFINSLMQNQEMYFIGRFAGDMFGYLKGSDDHRIYSLFEETGEKVLEAENIEDFIQKFIVNPKR